MPQLFIVQHEWVDLDDTLQSSQTEPLTWFDAQREQERMIEDVQETDTRYDHHLQPTAESIRYYDDDWELLGKIRILSTDE